MKLEGEPLYSFMLRNYGEVNLNHLNPVIPCKAERKHSRDPESRFGRSPLNEEAGSLPSQG